MPTFGFGAGAMYGTPLTDYQGNALANPTPVLFGVLQDVSVDISADVKELFGQNQFAEAIGRGKAKITGKAKFARVNGLMINSLFFGQTATSSIVANYNDVTGTVIPTTPFQITIAPPNAGVFAADLGVRNNAGNPMVRVASAPVTGQYSFVQATGVYTFAAADVGLLVFISYQYTGTSTVAKTSVVSNVAMGAAPTFQVDLSDGYLGNGLTLTLYKCLATKLSFATKQDDFMIPELDFSAFSNGAGQVLKWATSE